MKNFKLMLVMLLSLALIFSLCSCDIIKGLISGNGDCEHVDEDGDGICDKCDEEIKTGPSGEGLTLVENGEFKFQIVRGGDLKVDTVKLLDDLADTLEDDFGISLSVVNDTASTAKDCEVLIGTVTSRGEQYKYDRYSLGEKGYVIQAVDGKVIIAAGSDETLTKAVREFIEDILGIDKDTDEIGTVVLNDDNAVLKVQDDYRIKNITVGGKSIREDYKIVVDFTVNEKFRTVLRDAATQLQSVFYKQAGIYLDIVNAQDFEGDGNAIYLRGVAKGKAGSNGFRARVDGKDLIIECAHYNMFGEAFSTYYNKNLAFARDEELQLKKYDSDVNITKVSYADFGAVGDGVTDDWAAIKAAHDFANEGGQTVYANANKTYYINDAKSAIIIKTDVDWNNCKIIIDDSNVTVNANSNVAGITGLLRDNGMFNVVQDINNIELDSETIAKINANKDADGLVLRGLESGGETTKNIGFKPGFPCILQIRNSNNLNYLRYGYVDMKGSSQREIVLVDKDGNIDPSTPLLHDYTEVTAIYMHRTDTTPITIKNATIESRASRVNLLGGYHSIGRGISISRANVTLDNIIHEITGEIPKNQPVRRDANGLSVIAEGYTYSNGKIIDSDGKTYLGDDIKPFTGHSYGGLVSVTSTHNTLVKNVTFQARVYYEEGTYDIGASLTNKIVFQDCVQSNFFNEGTTVPNMSKCWGVAGTNYCKNMEYINCKLTRYDAHAGVTNGKIVGGELAVLRLIGGGEFLMDGVKIWSYNSGSPIQLREDYGASFNGTVTIKDCDIVDAYGNNNCGFSTLISVPSSYWDMGYETFMPNIVIDNLDIETQKREINLISGNSGSNMNYDSTHLYPYRDIITMNANDPNTAGYKFHYTTKTPDDWVAENITAEGARFYGCEYEVKENKGSGTWTVIVTDVKNQFVYHAPEFIKIVNNSDKSYTLALWDCAFLRSVDIQADRTSFKWTKVTG